MNRIYGKNAKRLSRKKKKYIKGLHLKYQQNLLDCQEDVEKFCKDRGISSDEFNEFTGHILDDTKPYLTLND